MPPRKETTPKAEPTPPGPIQLHLRDAGKIVWGQNVYGYTIDAQDDKTVITVAMKPE